MKKCPTEEHGIIVLRIGAALLIFNDEHKLGFVSTEARHRLPHDDENARLPNISFRIVTSPIVRVEVQSPSQSEEDMAVRDIFRLEHKHSANAHGFIGTAPF